jgi:hypothetical protein
MDRICRRGLRWRLRVVAGVSVLAMAASAAVRIAAQTTNRQDDAPPPRWHVGPYVGGARHSLVGTHLGVTPDRNHLFIGVHTTADIVRARRWSLAYAPEIVPLLLVSNNPTYRRISTTAGPPITIEDGRGYVAGFAVSPVGLETQIRVTSRWRAYSASAVGGVWFTREVPVAYSRAFNYTFEVGGGVLWRFHPRDSLRLGYKFHHLSNLYTAPQNPGIDGAVFLLGFERAIGSRPDR